VLEGLYSAAAGMAAQQQRLDSIANDVANVSTSGYKRLRVAFRDLVYQPEPYGAADGNVQAGAGAAATVVGRTFAAGQLQPTGEPLDVAVLGDGFLQVRLPQGGTALTRDGHLRVDAQGRLGLNTGELLDPPVSLPAGATSADVRIAPDGTVTANGATAGRIALVTVQAPHALAALGDNRFAPTAASGRPLAARAARLEQGALEMSNVDLGDAMVGMIDAQRSYSMASKALQMQDQLLQIANEVKRA
jgi:flagellar basal-body rod protein FlgG